MMYSSGTPDPLAAGSCQDVVVFPAPPAAQVQAEFAEFPKQPARRPATIPPGPVRTRAIRQVVVLEVAGRLGDVVADLQQAIELALANGPRGVVCDLSGVLAGAEPDAVEVLATTGRHVRDWSGISLAVVSPDPALREALETHPLGQHLIVSASMLPAVSAVLATPIPAVEWLRLAPHPTAPHASRNFVTRTLLRWGASPLIPSAALVVSELVTNSTVHAGTDIELSLAWNRGELRVTVRDSHPDRPHQRYSQLEVHGRGLFVVSALSRAVGVLPTADGGKVVWAVIDPARTHPTRPSSPEPEPPTTAQKPSVRTGTHGPTGLPAAPTSAAPDGPLLRRTGSGQLQLMRPPAA